MPALEDCGDSVTKLHLRRAVPGGSPDLALRPGQGQAGGLHTVFIFRGYFMMDELEIIFVFEILRES